MTKEEMMKRWEEAGMKFFSEAVRENLMKMNSEEQLKKLVNNHIEKFAPEVEPIE